jgi:hypothetical protein
MYKVDTGEYSNSTTKLLANICELLQENNNLLKQFSMQDSTTIVDENKIENKANIDTMERKEILAIIKTLPHGTVKGKYMAMNINDLRQAVKGVI